MARLPLRTVLVVALAASGCLSKLSDKYSRRVLLPSGRRVGVPGELALPAVDVSFRTRRGNRVQGWFLPNEKSSAGVVLLGGNAGNKSYHLLYARFLWKAGFNVLLFDYQGFGASPGRASILSLAADARAALDFLRAQPEVDRHRVGLFGISLGSVIALAVAAEAPHAVAAVVAEAPYDAEEQLAGYLHRQRDWPRPLAKLAAYLIAGLAFPAHFRPFDAVRRLTGVPLFFVHGEHDRLLPATTSTRLFCAAAGPKALWLLKDAGHAPEVLVTHDGEYQAKITGFFHRWLGRGAPRHARGFRWQVRYFPDGRFKVRLYPGVRPARPRPAEVITIARGGRHFQRHRIWLDGSPVELTPDRAPVAVALTPRHHPVRRVGDSWAPIPTGYTRSHHQLQAGSRRFATLIRQGPTGLPAAARVLARLSAARLDPRIRPELGWLYLRLGRQQERVGRPERALRSYTQALLHAPADPRRYYRLGDARFSVGPPRYLRRARARLRHLYRRLAPRPAP